MKVNRAYAPLFTGAPETDKRIVLLIGSRGSGKSRAVAQYLAMESARRRRRVALVRKVRDNIRDSQWKEIRDAVDGEAMESMFAFTLNPLGVRLSNGSEFVAKGLDDAEKVKSLAEVEEVWIEEATEIREDEFQTLNLGLRGAGRKRLILTCNPIKSFSCARRAFPTPCM
jgi:phage terminase large subunit